MKTANPVPHLFITFASACQFGMPVEPVRGETFRAAARRVHAQLLRDAWEAFGEPVGYHLERRPV